MRLLTTLQHSRALYASAASRSCTFQVRTVYALVRFRNLHLAADIACLDLNIECVFTKLLFFSFFVSSGILILMPIPVPVLFFYASN